MPGHNSPNNNLCAILVPYTGSSWDGGVHMSGHNRVCSGVHNIRYIENPKQKKSQATIKKTLNPKRVMTVWSRGGSFALARRAAHDPLGRGATPPGVNPKP